MGVGVGARGLREQRGALDSNFDVPSDIDVRFDLGSGGGVLERSGHRER
jgi:hypothetical protein